MNVKKVPPDQWPARTKLLKEAADKLGYGDRFRPLELAVTFDEQWTYDQPDPHNPAKSKPWSTRRGSSRARACTSATATSAAGARAQHARSQLHRDRRAARRAVVKPLHIVRRIRPMADGYEVTSRRSTTAG